MKSKTIILKISSIICFLFISAALVLIMRNPSQGYELSIYSATPPLIWAFLISAIIGGIVIVVYQVLREGKETGNWWKVGLSIILLSNLIIVLLPALKGYASINWSDHFSHLGLVKDILQFGSFGSNLIYPVTHILISQLCLVLNIPPIAMMPFIGPIFYLLFIIFTYLLCQEILPKPAAILATTCSTVLFCYYYTEVFPLGFAYMTFPLIFFLYFRASNKQSSSLVMLLICLIILTAFSHVVASVMLTLSLVVFELSKPLFSRLFITQREQESSSLPLAGRISLNLAAISFAVLMVWVWQNYSFWNHSVIETARWFRGEIVSASSVERALEGFAKLGLGPLQQLEFFFRGRGHQFIYLVLSLITIVMVARRRVPLSLRDTRSIFLLSIVFLVTASIQAVDYFRALTILTTGRFMWFIIPLLPPLVGLALYQIAGIQHHHKEISHSTGARFWKVKPARGMATALIIIICSVIGIFSIYPSVSTYEPNFQVSHIGLAGERWFLDNGNPKIEVMRMGTVSSRFKDALLGSRETTYPKAHRGWLGDHFNYPQYQSYGESFAEDRYLVLNKHDKLLYTEVWQTGRFTWDDFTRLENDLSVDKLYTNKEVDVWYVRGCQAH